MHRLSRKEEVMSTQLLVWKMSLDLSGNAMELERVVKDIDAAGPFPRELLSDLSAALRKKCLSSTGLDLPAYVVEIIISTGSEELYSAARSVNLLGPREVSRLFKLGFHGDDLEDSLCEHLAENWSRWTAMMFCVVDAMQARGSARCLAILYSVRSKIDKLLADQEATPLEIKDPSQDTREIRPVEDQSERRLLILPATKDSGQVHRNASGVNNTRTDPEVATKKVVDLSKRRTRGEISKALYSGCRWISPMGVLRSEIDKAIAQICQRVT